jgi:heme exporter protein A
LLFQALDCTVQPGQVHWVRGTNGCGKTSLLRMLAGVAHVAQGHIERHAPVVYLGHQEALNGDLTAQEALGFLLQLHAGGSAEAANSARQADALTHVGVLGVRHAHVRTLSQGQRRRVALARLCLCVPRSVWLLDEPLDALDDQGVAMVLGLVQAHTKRGGSVVMTSHQPVPLPNIHEMQLAAFGVKKITEQALV